MMTQEQMHELEQMLVLHAIRKAASEAFHNKEEYGIWREAVMWWLEIIAKALEDGRMVRVTKENGWEIIDETQTPSDGD